MVPASFFVACLAAMELEGVALSRYKAGVALPKLSESRVVIAGLFIFAFWLLVALPFLYGVPRYSHDETANKCTSEESKNHGFWEKASCDPTAYFTLWLVAFTGILAVSTIGLGVATLGLYQAGKNQIELARAEFAATHRAKLIIQSARLAFQGNDAQPAQIHFTIINTGETDATITEYMVQPYVQFNDDGFTPHFERGTPIIPEDMKVALGEPAFVIALCESVHWHRYKEFEERRAKLFVLGRVSYAASDGIRRMTGFCRSYSDQTGDWHVVKDSTYEYAY
jgi:hypothetical protein